MLGFFRIKRNWVILRVRGRGEGRFGGEGRVGVWILVCVVLGSGGLFK